MTRWVSVVAFIAGLVIWVRVMFFGVQQRRGTEYLSSRVWPLALSVFLMLAGMATYLRIGLGGANAGWTVAIVLASAGIAALVWRSVRASATAPSTDPEDDPRYRFQGHVARVKEKIVTGDAGGAGRVAFEFDGRLQEFRARWTAEAESHGAAAGLDDEVVIERVEDDVAFVEPWSLVEQRL